MTNPLARNIIRTFSTQVGCQIMSVLAGIVVARELGPSGKGFASYAVTAVGLVTVFFYGFGDAVLYQFGKMKKPAHAVHRVMVRVMLGMFALIIPAFVVVAIVAPSQRPLAAAAAALPFAIYVQLATPFLMVRDEIQLVNIRTIVQSIGTTIFTVGFLFFTHFGLAAVIGVWIAFYVAAAIQTYYNIRPIIARPDQTAVSEAHTEELTPANDHRGLMGEQLRFGLRAAGASAAGFLNLRIDIFVVSVMFASAELGWYTLAIASGEMLWQVSRAFVWSALGRIGSDPFDVAAALVARLTRNTLAIVSLLGIIAFFIGPWLIIHVYGERFTPAGSALHWALPGLVAYAAEVALTNFIILQMRKSMILIWVQSSAALICAGLTLATTGTYGIVAAAAATSVTKLIVTFVLCSIFLRGTGISPQRLLLIQPDDLRHYFSVFRGMLRTLRFRSA